MYQVASSHQFGKEKWQKPLNFPNMSAIDLFLNRITIKLLQQYIGYEIKKGTSTAKGFIHHK
jgi:hypothetical protein